MLAYSWQLDGDDDWAAVSRAGDEDVVRVMLDMWSHLPDPVVCASLYSIAHSVLMYPHLSNMLLETSSHVFICASFAAIAPSFSSDVSFAAVAICTALPTLQAMCDYDEMRSEATSSNVVNCVVECCTRSWDTLNRLLYYQHDSLQAAIDISAARVVTRQANASQSKSKTWDDVAASIDPLLMWSDHYVRSSDYASDGATAKSACPSPCAFASMSLPLCHLTTLSTSITFILSLTSTLKDSITTTPRILILTKSAILNCSAFLIWADLVRSEECRALMILINLSSAIFQTHDDLLRLCGEAASKVVVTDSRISVC